MKLNFGDILFFIIIGLMIFVALWLLKGSPTLMTAIISIVVFAAGSDLLIWRKVFEIDKNTAIGFNNVRNDLDNLKKEMKNGFNEIKGLIK